MRPWLATAALCIALVMPADARPRHHHHGNVTERGQPAQCNGIPWCGCWLRLRKGIRDRRYDVARLWMTIGRPSQCFAGAIAVSSRHVGEVTACLGDGRMRMISGNDGNAVRDRERSTRGFRFRAL